MADPAKLAQYLDLAALEAERLVEAAQKRGDTSGAFAYRLLFRLISIVSSRADQARSVQTWRS